jgi:hypothetical protein
MTIARPQGCLHSHLVSLSEFWRLLFARFVTASIISRGSRDWSRQAHALDVAMASKNGVGYLCLGELPAVLGQFYPH